MNDLALLRLEDPAVLGVAHALPLATDLAQAGSPVFTVGFPVPDLLGASPKVTDGVVSAATGLQNDPRTYQISVPVQPGNSGGPLLNMRGEVVGVVTSKFTAVQTENVYYAVKTAYLKALLTSVPKTATPASPLPRQSGTLEELAARVQRSVVLIVAQ